MVVQATAQVSDIGKQQTSWEYWFDELDSETEVAFNTYEYDWSKAAKNLGYIINDNNSIQYFAGKRSYDSDCYWTDDINNNSNLNNPLDYAPLFDNIWAAWKYGDNGDIRLWRVVN